MCIFVIIRFVLKLTWAMTDYEGNGIIGDYEESDYFGIIVDFDEPQLFGSKKRITGGLVGLGMHNYYIDILEPINSKKEFFFGMPIIFSINEYSFNPRQIISWRPVSLKKDLDLILEIINHTRQLEYYDYKTKYHQKSSPYFTQKNGYFVFDILIGSFSQILSGKNENTSTNLLFYGFNHILDSFDNEKIAYYYKSVKEAINLSNIKFSKAFLKKASKESNKYSKCKPKDLSIEKFLFKKRIIGLFNERLHDYQAFKLWQYGEYYVESEKIIPLPKTISDTPTKKKVEPVFHEDVFVRYRSELRPEDFQRIKSFNLSKKTQTKLISTFIKKKYGEYYDLQDSLFVICSFGNLSAYFDLIIKRISNRLMLNLWRNRRIFIDFESKKISLCGESHRFRKSFLLPEPALIKSASEITSQEISKIKKDYSNADVIIFKILMLKLEKKVINKKNYSDFIFSLKYLEPPKRIIFLDTYIRKYKVEWESLMNLEVLKIYPKKRCSILNFKFTISENHEKEILAVKTNPKDDFFISTLKYKYCLSPEHSISYLLKCIDKQIPDFKKLSYLKNFKSDELIKKVFSTWEFENERDTLELISYSQTNSLPYFGDFLKRLKYKITDFKMIYLIWIYKVLPEKFIIESIFEKLDTFDFNDFFLLERTFSKATLTKQQKEKLIDLFLVKSIKIRVETIYKILDFFINQKFSLNLEFQNKLNSLSNNYPDDEQIKEKLQILFK